MRCGNENKSRQEPTAVPVRPGLEPLKIHEQQLRLIADALPVLIAYVDPQQRYRFVNAACRKWFDLPAEAVEGRHVRETLGEPAYALLQERIAAVLAGQPQIFEAELPSRDSGTRFVQAAYVPHRDSAGRVLGYVALVSDVTAHKQTEIALQEANRRKTEFLAMMAHELRNPLAPIRNALHILKLPDLDETERTELQEMMERQVQHLVRLVDDLLDVSRITRGIIKLQLREVALASVVDQAVEMSRPLIEAQHHHLTVALPREAVRLVADPLRLTQMITNLLSNAAKFTAEGGRIELLAECVGEELVLRLRDTGLGITAEVLPYVFDLFRQAERAPDRAQGGLGIGLTLVRSLAEMHGGRVEAHSAGAGKGSEFVVRLPLRAANGSRKA